MSWRDGNASQLVGPPLSSRQKNVNSLDCSAVNIHGMQKVNCILLHITLHLLQSKTNVT